MFRGAKFISLHAKCKEPRQLRSSSSEFGSEGSGLQPKELHGSSTEFVSEEPSIQSKKSCLVVEIFAGSCRLSKACKEIGFRAAAVDKDESRAEHFPIYQCDVTNKAEHDVLLQYIEAEKEELLHIHFAQVAALLHELVSGHLGRHH